MTESSPLLNQPLTNHSHNPGKERCQRTAAASRSCSCLQSSTGLDAAPRRSGSPRPTWTWCVGLVRANATHLSPTTTGGIVRAPPCLCVSTHLSRTKPSPNTAPHHTPGARRAPGGGAAHGHLLRLGAFTGPRGLQGLRLDWVESPIQKHAEDGPCGPTCSVASIHPFDCTHTDTPLKPALGIPGHTQVEPHLIHDFAGEDFYGEELRFLICGYVRPEGSFPSLGASLCAGGPWMK